jgi:cell wall-associated NlpC family hydrolase
MPAIAAWRRSLVAVPALVIAALTLSLSPAATSTASAATTTTGSIEAAAIQPLTYTRARIQARNEAVRHALSVARAQKGDPYVYGAAGPNAFDCSGLTSFSFGRAGIYLPRSSDAQASYARRILKRNMRKGDLMFFYSGSGVYHVGIFAGWFDGHRYILHASRSGTPVKVDPVWTRSWFPGTMRLA